MLSTNKFVITVITPFMCNLCRSYPDVSVTDVRHSNGIIRCRTLINFQSEYIGSVRYAEFTPRPVNQAGAQGQEAGMRLANGGARQRRRRGKMHKRRAYRVAGLLCDDGMIMI